MASPLSMTGYGEGRAEGDRIRVSVAVRTLNHRFLDLQLRLPDAYRSFELELAAAVKRRLRRGRVEARYQVDPVAEPRLTVKVRRQVAAGYRRAARDLAAEAAERGAEELSPAELLQLPEVVAVEPAEDPPGEAEGRLLLAATEQALDAVVETRRREGRHLKEGLCQRLARMRALRDDLDDSAEEIQRGLTAALGERLEELVGDHLEPARLAQEAAILADRSDVREELDRLAAHLDAYSEVLDGDGERGKRLDFLTQEVLRELNTLGAKCRHSGQLERVVEAKTICEQLREQVQNLE